MELTGKRFWILGLQLIVIVSILSCTTKKISSPVALGNIFTPAFFQTEEYLSVIDYLGKNLCLQDEMERYTYKICVKIDSLGFVKQATLIDVVQHSHNDSIFLRLFLLFHTLKKTVRIFIRLLNFSCNYLQITKNKYELLF